MFRKTIYGSFRLLGVTAAAAAALFAASCSKTDDLRPGRLGADVLTLSFRLDGDTTRADGEQPSSAGVGSENKVESVDLFFYTDETAPATFAASATPTTTTPPFTVQVSLGGDLSTVFGRGTTCKVYAVANCAETKALIAGGQAKLTLDELKAATTTAAESYFRSAKAPESFVMTSFSSGAVEITCNSDYTELVKGSETAPAQSVELKRLAAKIRAAINLSKVIYAKNGQMIVKEEAETERDQTLLDEGYTRWTPDVDDMRVYINNGVRKARLDGTVPDGLLGADGDYYAIATSGSRETEDFELARLMVSDTPVYADYPYYNATPLYTYPNAWTDDSSLDNHVTTLTIVVPWETEVNNETDDETTWRPTYYTVQVNNKEAKIEPNKYYYLRMHIGRMGGLTSLTPVELDPLECEILGWGKAKDTEADMRPQRFLYFSQDEYIMANETKISIPFASTHDCVVQSVKGVFYVYNTTAEVPYVFDDNTKYDSGTNNAPSIKGNIYDYVLDNETNTLTFSHHFFDGIFDVSGAGSILSENYYTETKRDPATGESYKYKNRINDGGERIFCRVDFYITLKHFDLEDGTEYEQTVHFATYPPIYIGFIANSGDSGEAGRALSERGYVYVNGQDNGISHLFGAYGRGSGSKEGMTVISISQFDEEDMKNYTIGDPRTYYINNDLSDASMASDFVDQINYWTETNTNGDYRLEPANSNAPTLWKYLSDYGVDYNVYWDQDGDKNNRAIRYYYPASPAADKVRMISPKFMFSSEYAYTGTKGYPVAVRRRCAAYQEYGYPAGRWRLPTRAEFEYAYKLQSNGLIPRLFVGDDYCTAEQMQSNGTGYMRCVYDLWYWENIDGTDNKIPLVSPYDDSAASKELYKTFMWGDRPKQNPQAEALIEAYKKGTLQ